MLQKPRKTVKTVKTVKLWYFAIFLGLVLLHLKSSNFTHGGSTMSLSLVKLSDNGFHLAFWVF